LNEETLSEKGDINEGIIPHIIPPKCSI